MDDLILPTGPQFAPGRGPIIAEGSLHRSRRGSLRLRHAISAGGTPPRRASPMPAVTIAPPARSPNVAATKTRIHGDSKAGIHPRFAQSETHIGVRHSETANSPAAYGLLSHRRGWRVARASVTTMERGRERVPLQAGCGVQSPRCWLDHLALATFARAVGAGGWNESA